MVVLRGHRLRIPPDVTVPLKEGRHFITVNSGL